MKNGAALLLGGSRPEGRRKCSMLPKSLDPDVSNYNSLAHAQQPVSTHRPKLFFGQLSSYQTRSRACPRGKIEYLYLDFGTATSIPILDRQPASARKLIGSRQRVANQARDVNCPWEDSAMSSDLAGASTKAASHCEGAPDAVLRSHPRWLPIPVFRLRMIKT